MFGSVALLPIGYALVGPFAAVLGIAGTSWLAAGWMVVSSAVVLAVPGVTQLRAERPSRP